MARRVAAVDRGGFCAPSVPELDEDHAGTESGSRRGGISPARTRSAPRRRGDSPQTARCIQQAASRAPRWIPRARQVRTGVGELPVVPSRCARRRVIGRYRLVDLTPTMPGPLERASSAALKKTPGRRPRAVREDELSRGWGCARVDAEPGGRAAARYWASVTSGIVAGPPCLRSPAMTRRPAGARGGR